ncbi:MAG: hypothetical protein ABMB14_14470 [Myxococcota bacterium]
MSTALAERRLILLGAALVLLAMATGLFVGPFPTVPLILSAHLAATMSGTLMIAVGAALSKVSLGDGERSIVVWGLAASGYLNWVATLLGAALGTHALTPVHGAGTAGVAAEAVVGGLLVAMVIGTFAGLAVLVRGAARG